MKNLAPVLAFLVAAAGPAAQQPVPPPSGPQTPQPPAVFRSSTSLVALNVTVTDGRQFVAGLQSGDFAVFEDGVRQQVQFFEAGKVPLDLMILIDTSSSMRDRMESVHEAALGFMKTLRAGDRGAVVAFGDQVTVTQPLTADRAALEAAIKGTVAMGGTALNNALYIAIREFGRIARESGEIRRQAIAVLSDGQDTGSLLSFDDVLEQARRSGVNIYTIALKSRIQPAAAGRRYFSESDYAMRTLAAETGAQAFFPTQVGELKGVYARIADELSSQYSIGYAPSNARPDGRYRRIVVRVTSRPELKPRARSGYLAAVAPAMPSGIDPGVR